MLDMIDKPQILIGLSPAAQAAFITGVFSILAIVTKVIFDKVDSWCKWNKELKEKSNQEQKDFQEKLDQSLVSATEANKALEKSVSEISHRIDKVDEKLDVISAGTLLALESDSVQFEAFKRNNLMNGDSDAQRAKIHEFFMDCANNSMKGEDGGHEDD